ncbi:MAG: hypothetical protein NTY07_06060 [Bacteroidia bacterium]|nr:hypothetical protein [Bacteroidia bacterium]
MRLIRADYWSAEGKDSNQEKKDYEQRKNITFLRCIQTSNILLPLLFFGLAK